MSTVVVWTPSLSSSNGQNIVTKAVISNLKPKTVLEYPTRTFGLRFWRAYVRNFIALIKIKDPVIYLVISRTRLGFIRDFPILILQYFGTIIVVHCHGSDITCLLQYSFIGKCAKKLFEKVPFITPSRHILYSLKEHGLKNVTHIDNYQSLDCQTRNASPPVKNEQIIIWNSNIVKSKGVFKVCQTVASLDTRFHLNICGQITPERHQTHSEIKAELDHYTAHPRIKYLGSLKPEKMNAELVKSDIIIFPSNYPSECQPLAIISAMCHGKRIVLEDTPALRATAQDYPVVFVEHSTPEKLVCAVEQVLDLHASALSKAARKARSRFSEPLFIQKLSEILENSRTKHAKHF